MAPGRSSELKNSVNSLMAPNSGSSNPSSLWNTAMAGIPSSIGYLFRSISSAWTDSTPTGRNSSCSLVVTSDIGGATKNKAIITPIQIRIVITADLILLYG